MMKVSSILLLYLSANLQLGKNIVTSLQHAPVAYPVTPLTLYETNPLPHIHSYLINMVATNLLNQACSKLDEINQNYNFTFHSNHFKTIGNEIANETEQLTLTVNNLPKMQKEFSNLTTNLMNTENVHGLFNILNINNRVKRSSGECNFSYFNKTSLDCISTQIKTKSIQNLSQNFKNSLANWMLENKFSPSNIRQIAFLLKTSNYSTNPPEKMKAQILQLISPNIIQNDATSSSIGQQFISHTNNAISQFDVFSNKNLLIQANSILSNYKKGLTNMIKKIKNKQLKTFYNEKILNITIAENELLVATKLLTKMKIKTFLYKTVPLCGYESCIKYHMDDFLGTSDLRKVFSLDTCIFLDNNSAVSCLKLMPAKQLKCVFGSEYNVKSTNKCEFKYVGKITEFSSINSYQKFKVGYIQNSTNFGNILLSPDYLYRLSTNKDQIVEMDNQEIQFFANEYNIFDFEALKLKMTRKEIDILCQRLIFNSKFHNIFTHSTLNSSFIFILFILLLVTCICQTKKQCAKKRTYTQAPREEIQIN